MTTLESFEYSLSFLNEGKPPPIFIPVEASSGKNINPQQRRENARRWQREHGPQRPAESLPPVVHPEHRMDKGTGKSNRVLRSQRHSIRP